MSLAKMQKLVWEWCQTTFEGIVDWSTTRERSYRFLEESLELFQALGMSQEDALRVVEYVYERPIGYPPQEVGGVLVTLLTLCAQQGIDAEVELDTEYSRIITPEITQKIRNKQEMKKQRLI